MTKSQKRASITWGCLLTAVLLSLAVALVFNWLEH
jgi:hypothetical protein